MSRSPATPAGRRVASRRAAGTRRRRAPASARAKPRAAPKRKPAAPKRKPAARRADRKPKPAAKRASRRRRRARRAVPRRRHGGPWVSLRAPATWRARIALALGLVAVIAGGYFGYLRDSSLVAVTDVEVVGVRSGEDPRRIVAEFDAAAREMTTLHVDRERLEEIAAAYPTIESVSPDPNFPHGLRIEVTEHDPALLARAGGRVLAVAADGSLLAGIQLPEEGVLPTLELERPPAGDRLEGTPLAQALVVGAAPEPLRPLIEKVGHSKEFGVELVLRGGIPVRFGTGLHAARKWEAAAAVLADGKLDALTYLDVRVPKRPAAGGAAAGVAATDPPA